VAVIPCQDIRIESGKTSLYNVFPRFYVPRTGNVVAFSVMVVLLNEEGDRGTYPLLPCWEWNARMWTTVLG
jgi:hypothetical protein